MILCDHEIINRCINHNLIEPFEKTRVQPASYDCSLSDTFRVFNNHKNKIVDLSDIETYIDISDEVVIPKLGEFVLHPGEFVLGATQEVVNMPLDLTSRIEGKSSLGRLGLIVHSTAGYIDPGFNGPITLEMTNLLGVPLVLHPGDLIAQLSFSLMSQIPVNGYSGRYQGDTKVAPSRYGMAIK